MGTKEMAGVMMEEEALADPVGLVGTQAVE
jgi:hypothetical protein